MYLTQQLKARDIKNQHYYKEQERYKTQNYNRDFYYKKALRKMEKHTERLNTQRIFHIAKVGKIIVEDVKGKETDVFKLKHKLFEKKYPDLTLKIIK